MALGKTVREIEEMPASEVEGWRAFYQIQPFGPWRDNYHSAMVAHILASANRNPHRAAPRLSEFMYKDAETAQRERELEAVAFFDIRSK